MRLDVYLQEKGYAQSRNKAAEMIKAREVFVNGKVATKASLIIDETHKIETTQSVQYVSRAGLKLKGFLQDLPDLSINNKTCLDIGSSTGGFTEVLLEYGAASVTCVDVGCEQLHVSLRNHPKITLFENTDIRNFESKQHFDIVTCDVSFIAIEKILPDINRISSDLIIILFKPQFQVGKDSKRTTRGVLKDGAAIERAKDLFLANIFKIGWKTIGCKESIVKGKEGNAETFYYFSKR